MLGSQSSPQVKTRRRQSRMAELIWSRQAISDVARLHAFLKHRSPAAAMRAVDTIRQSLNILREQPKAGHPAGFDDPAIREWVIPFGGSGYVVLYRHDCNQTIVLAIRHQRESGYGPW